MIGFRRDRGFLLFELMIAIGIFTVILSIVGVCVVKVMRMDRRKQAYSERLAAAEHVLRLLADDVRKSSGFIPGGSSDTLILTQPNRRIVAYKYSADGMERIEGDLEGSRAEIAARLGSVKVSFDFEGAEPAAARSVLMTAEWDEAPGIGLTHPMLCRRIALRNAGVAHAPAPEAEQ